MPRLAVPSSTEIYNKMRALSVILFPYSLTSVTEIQALGISVFTDCFIWNRCAFDTRYTKAGSLHLHFHGLLLSSVYMIRDVGHDFIFAVVYSVTSFHDCSRLSGDDISNQGAVTGPSSSQCEERYIWLFGVWMTISMNKVNASMSLVFTDASDATACIHKPMPSEIVEYFIVYIFTVWVAIILRMCQFIWVRW